MEFSPVQSVSSDLPFFAELTLGNAHAVALCRVLGSWFKLLDEQIGQMGAKAAGTSAEDIIRINLEAFATFAQNPFWQEHKKALLPLVIQAANAYADSLSWAKRENFRDRATAQILRTQYQEVFWHVAKLCGGYEHMVAMTQKYRRFDYVQY